ncbi:inhibin beta chain [Aethina tumida]|uniref:inhibin beta chain n=1 Tax=Aethina tumida TaxID=116153 RepID=UPI00096B3805|nr:inhibin beta chain [Aethina tumida]
MKFRLVFLVLLIFTVHNVWTRDVRSVFGAIFEYKLPAIMSNEPEPEAENVQTSVPEDEDNPSVPFAISEKEFTALRIEYIKNQILKKLRLKEMPTSTIDDLPIPLKEDNFLPQADDNLIGSDDFYGKTTQAIIFPSEDEAKCLKKIRVPSACLPFQMPNDIYTSDVSSAELWFHKKEDILDQHNQTFVISEVAHWDTNKSFQKTKPIAIQETHLKGGWLKVDVTYIIKNWLELQDSPTHAINIACKTCGMDKTKSPISFNPNLKPFLVIYTHSRSRKSVHRRPKRSLTCEAGVNECCRESLYISFAEIGWDNWIIKPEGYNAYFCKGSCISPAALTLSANAHNTVLRKLINGESRQRGNRPEITPCCAATQYQQLQLVYKVNTTVSTKILPNMIVESCGCF